MIERPDIVEEAARWRSRIGHASATEWRGFVAWLEASPAHAAAYDRIAIGGRVASSRDSAGRDPRARAGLGRVGAAAVAASMLAALLAPTLRPAPDTGYVVATAPGQPRVVTLVDGTRIELNGGTRIRLDPAAPRVVRLDRGQAVFHVRHDPSAPFEVRAGDRTLRDVGTTFDVTRDDGRLDVQVADGAVLFEPGGAAVTLTAGMSLAQDGGDGVVRLGRVAPGLVGGWRTRRLSFSGAALRGVARAVERTTGARIAIDPALAGTVFSGSFRLSGDGSRDVAYVAGLAGVTYRRDRQGWIMTPRADDPR